MVGLTFSSVLVECALTAAMFEGVDWRQEFDKLCPDMTIYRTERKQARVFNRPSTDTLRSWRLCDPKAGMPRRSCSCLQAMRIVQSWRRLDGAASG